MQRRNYSGHTLASYRLDLQVFFAGVDTPLDQLSFRDVDRFIGHQHHKGLAPTTINRRLHALKHFFDCLIERQIVGGNPLKPSHVLRRGSTLPRRWTKEQIEQFFAQVQHAMDRALFLLMLRCGWRVSEVAQLKRRDIDWSQQALIIEQGKGRKDRRVSLSADAVTCLREGLKQRPSCMPSEQVCWNQKQPYRPLSITAIQKKMERYAKAAGIAASCQRVRQSLCLQQAGARRGDGVHQRAARACFNRLERAVGKGVESAGQTGLCEDHPESHATEQSLRVDFG